MTDLVTLTANVEAFGHPTQCTEPAPGTVVEEKEQPVTITNSSGQSQPIATIDTAEINIPTHCHTYDVGCEDCYAHSIDPRIADASSSLTINGSPVYILKDDVQSDPGSGGNVDIIDTGINISLTETIE